MFKKNKFPSVSIVVIVRNMQGTISSCLQSLTNQNIAQDKYEIIVVDNNSTDNTKQIIQQYPVRLFSEKTVGNFGGARNKGIKESRGAIVAFVDADCTVDKGYIRKILNFHSLNPDITGMCGSLINPYPKNKVARTLCYGQCGFWSPKAPKRLVNFLPGCNSSYQKAALLEVGMFPEETASEDIILGQKLIANGKRLLFDPSYPIVHNFDKSLQILSRKEERCGTAHFNMYSSKKNMNTARLAGIVFFMPIFIVGRTMTGFQRMLKFSLDKKDAILLFHYLVYSGVFWTRGYQKQAFRVRKTQLINQKVGK